VKRKRHPQPYARRSAKFIVKVQRPLAGSVSDPPALVYNEDRSLMQYVPFNYMLRSRMGDDLKQYWWAYVQAKVLYLDRPAPEQEW
jgi:hypothetical protein